MRHGSFPLRRPGPFLEGLAGGPVVVQSHFVSRSILLLLARATGRIAPPGGGPRGESRLPKGPLMRGAERLRGAVARRLVDEAIGVSGFVARRLVSLGLDPERVKVVHNGVDVGRWPARQGAGPVRPPLTSRVGCTRRRSIHGASAFERLERRLPGVEIPLAGGVPSGSSWKDGPGAELIHLLGTVRGLGPLFRDIDVLLPDAGERVVRASAAEAMCSRRRWWPRTWAGCRKCSATAAGCPGAARTRWRTRWSSSTRTLDGCAGLGRRGRARVLERFTLDRAVDALADPLEHSSHESTQAVAARGSGPARDSVDCQRTLRPTFGVPETVYQAAYQPRVVACPLSRARGGAVTHSAEALGLSAGLFSLAALAAGADGSWSWCSQPKRLAAKPRRAHLPREDVGQ